MRVISFCADGIREAAKKGFYDWATEQDADIICVQDLRAAESALGAARFNPDGYFSYFFDAIDADSDWKTSWRTTGETARTADRVAPGGRSLYPGCAPAAPAPAREGGQLAYPWASAPDAHGRIAVVDSGNNRVQVFSSEGIFIKSWGTYGEAEGEFDNPCDIFIGPAGQVIVTDSGNDRFQEFTDQGLFTSYGGGPGLEPGQFLNPNGVSIDSKGNLYIVDTDNHRVQVFSSQ